MGMNATEINGRDQACPADYRQHLKSDTAIAGTRRSQTGPGDPPPATGRRWIT
jgi:hypothetical protein